MPEILVSTSACDDKKIHEGDKHNEKREYFRRNMKNYETRKNNKRIQNGKNHKKNGLHLSLKKNAPQGGGAENLFPDWSDHIDYVLDCLDGFEGLRLKARLQIRLELHNHVGRID